MRAPEFWTRNDLLARLAAAALSPAGAMYNASVRWKAVHSKPYRPPIPVLCVGNISAGGTGKTPIAVAIADNLIARGKNPFFLTRGYRGSARAPVVVTPRHGAEEVGDEPLILSRKAATVVSPDRGAGAKLAVERGADVIVMDDGHQNFAVAKDLSIVVIDAETGFGNGKVLPAGPLRETAAQGLIRADAVVLMGDDSPSLPGFDGPVLRARVEPAPNMDWQGRPVLAFAGIGRPEKFFRTVQGLGAAIIETVAFPDHHRFGSDELESLKSRAREHNAQLLTTEKDYVRLGERERDGIAMLPIHAVIEPADRLESLLDRLLAPR